MHPRVCTGKASAGKSKVYTFLSGSNSWTKGYNSGIQEVNFAMAVNRNCKICASKMQKWGFKTWNSINH